MTNTITPHSSELHPVDPAVTVIECSQDRALRYLNLTKKDLEEAIQWAEEDSDEVAPSTAAVEIAHRVAEGIMPFWPQHFDVYPLDGDIAIDSETVGKSFVMVVCKSDESATTMVTIRGKRLRKDWRAEDLDKLINFAGTYLVILRKMKGADTFEYTIHSWSGRDSWKRNFNVDVSPETQKVSKQQIAFAGVSGGTEQTHLGGQTECLPGYVYSSSNSYTTGLEKRTHLLRLGRSQSIDDYGQWEESGFRPNPGESFPRPNQTTIVL